MILLTGGSGLLGTQLRMINPSLFYAPSHRELDITKKITPIEVDVVIHSAAYTNVVGAELEQEKCFDVNVNGTKNLLKAYPKTPFVYISSEYAGNPVNYYSWTKRWAEQAVAKHPKHLIIRTLFKPRPFPYDKAFINQYTMGDYVDVIAPMILEKIEDFRLSELCYIGTGRKTIYDLAKETKDVRRAFVEKAKVILPHDYI